MTGKKGASGAPRKESLCGEYVAVLLTAQDRTWIDSVALRSGRSVSSVVRRIVERARKSHTTEQEAAL